MHGNQLCPTSEGPTSQVSEDEEKLEPAPKPRPKCLVDRPCSKVILDVSAGGHCILPLPRTEFVCHPREGERDEGGVVKPRGAPPSSPKADHRNDVRSRMTLGQVESLTSFHHSISTNTHSASLLPVLSTRSSLDPLLPTSMSSESPSSITRSSFSRS